MLWVLDQVQRHSMKQPKLILLLAVYICLIWNGNLTYWEDNSENIKIQDVVLYSELCMHTEVQKNDKVFV